MNKHPLADCGNCPLNDRPFCPTSGPVDAKVAVVSRSPAIGDTYKKMPFSGESGKVLNHLLAQNGIKRDDVKVTNVVLCSPEKGKVPPDAIKACAPRVAEDIKNAELVIAAGSEAVNLIIGRGSIDKFRGYRIDRNGQTFVAANNPALVLRDDSTFPNLVKDFKRAFHPIPEPTLPRVTVIEDIDDARELLSTLRNEPGILACDVESRGGLTHKASLVSMQFGMAHDEAYVLGERAGLFTDQTFIADFLRPLLESRNHAFIWHNGKFDIKILRASYGINARVDEDTMLLSYATDERGGVHSLEYCLMEEFGWPNYEPASVKEFKKTGRLIQKKFETGLLIQLKKRIITQDEYDSQLAEHESGNYDALYEYAGRDAGGTRQLYDLLADRCDRDGTRAAYRRLLIEGSEALARMELAGFRYNHLKSADILEEEVVPKLNEQRKEMRAILGNPIYSPRSVKQTSYLYYDAWQVDHAMRKRPDKERSCDEAALKEIAAGRWKTTSTAHVSRTQVMDFTEVLMKFRTWDKQATQYLFGLMKEAINDPESKIYTSLLLHGTTSGRLSSRDPNLQNVTRGRDGLPNIRDLFVASPGRLIVQADYSQAELRCIAAFSGDPILTRVYENDEDLHNLTATRFFGVDFTKANRDNSKNMNFGMFYGQSPETFQEKHGIPATEARKYIDWAKREFKRVWEWEAEVQKEVRKNGYLFSPFGRKRRFHLLTPENLQAVFREAVNFLPQTTASDCTLRSVIVLSNEIDWNRAALVLTVHDSILGDVEESYVDEYNTICKQVMESRPKEEIGWTIPFKADIQMGPTWGSVK